MSEDAGVADETAAPIRVVLADDQALVRGALRALLELEPDMTVLADVGDGEDAVAAVRDLGADVALLDIEMPGLTGIEATARLRQEAPQCRVLIVTTFGRPGYLRRSLDAGAWGFVVKDTPSEELAEAVRRVHRGERVMDPRLAQESLVAGANPLTEREREVLRASLDGASVREMAATLYLSPGTVRNHLSNAIGKTLAENRMEAALVARDHGWL